MKRHKLAVAAAIGFAACLALGLTTREAESTAMPQAAPRWQHMAITYDLANTGNQNALTRKIDKAGEDGWELVSVEGVLDEGTTTKRVYYFKRSR